MEPDKIENETDFEKTEAPALNTNNEVASIRTYKSDVAEFIKREGKTLADIAIAESSRRTNLLKEEISTPIIRRKAIYIIGAVFFLVALSIGTLYFILKPKSNPAPIPTTGKTDKALFVSGIKEKNFSIGKQNGESVLSAISIALKEVTPFLALHLVSENNLGEESLISSRDFLERIGVYPPGVLIRTLSPDLALGSIGGKARFLVIKNNYYGGAFSGMLQWEKTMVDDLRNLLDLDAIKSSRSKTEIVGATTSISQLAVSGFKDALIANRDSRIFKDGSGAIILLYLFPDNNTIIIAGSENTAKIVVEKLLRTKVK